MLNAFIQGFILAFGLIIPLGVQNIFVFNQGVSQASLLKAAPSVLTAFICDFILIAMAVLGVSLIILSLPWLKLIIFSLGFVFLLYMGWVTWNAKPTNFAQAPQPLSIKRQIIFAMTVSLLNPHAIIDTVAVIGTSSLLYEQNERWAFTSACVLVSLLWFWGLAIAGHHLRKFDKSGNGLLWINRLSALIIWGMAIYIGRLLAYLII